MKILVTGGAGFIGSHVVDLYIEEGHEVAVVDNLSSGKREYVNKDAQFYEVDIRDKDALKRVFEEFKPDVINHHAAQISVQYSVENPLYDADVNVIGSLNLITLALQHEVEKFIYISSGGAVYGEPEKLPCSEDHPVNPLSPYGVTKHVVEHYLYLFNVNDGLDYIILRYPNVYGPRQDPYGEAGVVAIFSLRMLRNEEVYIFGDGTQERDFVYVKDVAMANIGALTYKAHENSSLARIFNLGSGRGTSVNEIYSILKRLTGYKRDAIYAPRKKGEVYKISLDATKARRELGWSETYTLEEGLSETVEWFKRLA